MTAHPHQVVEIAWESERLRGQGSGYVVAPGVVLTARHVVADRPGGPTPVRIRRATDPDWLDVSEIVPAADDALDAMVLLFGPAADATDEPPDLAVVDVDQALPFHATGFPRVQRQGKRRHPESARGVTEQFSGPPTVISLHVESAAPQPEPDRTTGAGQAGASAAPQAVRSGWSGLSGAAVFTVGGLLLGMVTDDHGEFGGRRLEAVPAARLAADPKLRRHLPERWEGTGRRRLSNELTLAMGSGLRVRITSPQPPPDEVVRTLLRQSWLAPLRAAHQVVDFTGRQSALNELTDWLRAPEPTANYAVISGIGGSGKSRLARELCRWAVEAGWVAGPAEIVTTDTRPARADVRRPVLLVLDYMDGRADQAGKLLSHLRNTGDDQVRVVLVVRVAEQFLRRLGAVVGLDHQPPAVDLRLTRESFATDERIAHYRAAHAAFSRLHDREPGPAPAAAELTDRLTNLSTPLLVHARALLDAREGSADVPGPADASVPTLLATLVDREDALFWEPALADVVAGSPARRQVMAVASLVDAPSTDEAGKLLTVVDGLGAAPGRGADVAARLPELNGDGHLPAVQPDLLGEHLITHLLFGTDRVERLFDLATAAEQRSGMLEILLRMCASPYPETASGALETLRTVISRRLPELVDQAIQIVDETDDPVAGALPERLAAALGLVDRPETAAQVAERTFPPDSRLQHLSAVIYGQAVAHWQGAGDLERSIELRQRTVQAYLNAGQADAALPWSTEALAYVSRFPGLSQNSRLGKVLTSHSLVRAGTGNPAAAVDAAREAVEIAERAEAAEPGRYGAQLAEARAGLWTVHVAAMELAQARAVAEQASRDVEGLPPQLAMTILAQYSTSLMHAGEVESAMLALSQARDLVSLDSPSHVMLTGTLAGLREANGELEEALLLAAESVAAADRLPDPLSQLARATRAQIRLTAAAVFADHDDAEALRLTGEARDLLRSLYEEAPTLYGAMFAVSWLSHAELLATLGHADRGVREAALAYATVEELYERHPQVVYGLLAPAAMARATTLTAADRAAEAGAALTDTLTRLGRLDLPGRPQLQATLLVAQALLLLEHLDDPAGALAAATDAVRIVRGLVGRPGAEEHRGLLISCLILAMLAAVGADRPEQALAAGDEAVELARQVADETHVDLGRRQYALVLALRGDLHHDSDRYAEAVKDYRAAYHQLNVVTPLPGDHDDLVFLDGRMRDCAAALDDGTTPPPVAAPDTGDDSLSALVVGEPTDADPLPWRHRVVLGTYRGVPVAAGRYRPVLVLGPQRSRKTTSLVTPTLLEWDGPALVTSVRTDVLSATIRKRRAMGEVSVFEPAERLVRGSAVKKWNPLDDCRTWEGAIVAARSLTESSRVSGRSGVRDGQYWYTSATQLLQSLMYAAAATGKGMADVVRWVRSMERAEVTARLHVAPEPVEPLAAFTGIQSLADVTMASVYGVAATLLSAYDSVAVQRNSETDFVVADFFDGRANTLYLCAPPEDQELLAPIFTALIRRVIAEAYRRQAVGETVLPLLLLLDEAGNIATIESLDGLATTAAGTRIQLVTVFHDISQIEGVYGESRARSIVNNHSAMLLLPNNRDPQTTRLVRDIMLDDRSTAGQRSLRRMAAGTALCVYENLTADTIVLRSSDHDADLRRIAGDPVEDDPAFRDVLTFGRGAS
ncbi:type IV secretory system conjugative DNA transfer family protein [Micromonospora sp. NPDC051141]|uniref:type IV secretory system conjugative DNA transfer family protein n=1 Tax=Micromonospora sp. NPDC051141 TaxID=3364284 RepID=UPI003798CBE7